MLSLELIIAATVSESFASRAAEFQDLLPLVNLSERGGMQKHVILSAAKDLLKRIDYGKTRSFASLRMTCDRSPL